jgi:hypothetical protein
MDYAAWVQRLRKFILDLRERSPVDSRDKFIIEVAPPLEEQSLKTLDAALDCGLPPPIREFLRTGASSIFLQYSHSPEDEETSDIFCSANQLVEWRDDCLVAAQRSWAIESDWPLDRAFWRHALPLIHYPTSDGVALWVHDPQHPNPPVIYLKHDDASFLLARDFDEFLREWERLGFTGAYGLEQYRDPQTGFLDSTTPKALAFRKALGLEV